MFYNSPLTRGVPWLVLDVQVFLARNGKERKKRKRGIGRKERFSLSLSLPPTPYPRFFSLRFPRSERLEQACVRNWFWDCYRGRAGQLLAKFSPSLRKSQRLCAKDNSAQFPFFFF